MTFRGIGVAGDAARTPEGLDRVLGPVVDAGFTHYELPGYQWDVWNAGRLHVRQLAGFERVVDRWRDRIAFTLHGPLWINLFDVAHPRLHQGLLAAGLEACRALGTDLMVYHPGHRLPPPGAGERTTADLMGMEREFLARAGEDAARWGGAIAVENMTNDPGGAFSYAALPEMLAGQVEAVGLRNVGACIDFGHLWLSADWFGFDPIDGVRRLAPLTNHLHVQDLFGTSGLSDTPELGLGDLHLPPGLGAIPYERIAAEVCFPRDPLWLVELADECYWGDLPAIADEARRVVDLAPDAAAPAGTRETALTVG